MPKQSFNQWSVIEPYISSDMKPAFVADPDDQLRLAAYSMYEQIWRNVPQAFELVQRGSDANPIYLPSAKKCIEATNRYLGVGFDIRIDGGTTGDQAAADNAIRTIWRREKFRAKFGSLKRMSLVRGDAIWHITADPNKPAGRRISLHEIDPAKYHPIYDFNDAENLIGVHLVEKIVDPKNKNKQLVKRQTYRKKDNPTGPSTISSELTIWESDGWDDRQQILNPDYQMKPWSIAGIGQKEFDLPPEITAIPVYAVTNQYESSLPFGLSELAGFERVIAALNQGITDEELSLAFMGLGLYASTAPRPSGGWILPPGSVVEMGPTDKFLRVDGVTSVTPSLNHLNFLEAELKQAMGTPDIAIGNVDVNIAESGIALALQMGPILTRNKEKEDFLLALHDNMFFDLLQWLAAYEKLSIAPVTVVPSFDNPMPVDESAEIDKIVKMMSTTPPLISAEYGRRLLVEKLGYDLPNTMGADVLTEIENSSKAQLYDPFADRVAAELAQAQGAEGIPVNGSSGA